MSHGDRAETVSEEEFASQATSNLTSLKIYTSSLLEEALVPD